MLKKSILLVSPQIAGGTKRHFEEMANEWFKQKQGVIKLEIYHTLAKLYIWINGKKSAPLVVSIPNDESTLLHLLKKCDVEAIHYHHFMYMNDFWLDLPKKLGVSFFVTLHDYYVICPLIKLIGIDNCYCQLPSVNICNKCLAHNKIYFELDHKLYIKDIKEWRYKWKKYLSQAKKIFVPHKDVQMRLMKVWPDLKTMVIENPEIVPLFIEPAKLNVKSKNIRVGIIGGLEKAKGSQIILAVAKEINRRNLPINLILFGELFNYKGEIPKSLTVLGRYTEAQVYQQIVDNAIDYFIFPPIWPETYSYTLTIPIRLGIPVLGVDIGAIGARIQENGWGEVYPYDSSAEYICKRLMNFDYKHYSSLKENFKIKNDSFPLARELYGREIENTTTLNIVDIVNSIGKLNQRIEYSGLNNVIFTDFMVLKSWGLSKLAVLQMVKNINWEYFFKQLIRKVYRLIIS